MTIEHANPERGFWYNPEPKEKINAPNVLFIGGVRPNFVKLASLITAARIMNMNFSVVHTGQHSDNSMSAVFFQELDIPSADVMLKLDDRSTESIKKATGILVGEIKNRKPDFVAVIGDVASTVICAEAAKSIGSKLVHIESGLRSGEIDLPEENNRRRVDHMSDILFCSEPSAVKHLKREGINQNVFLVGDLMIDTLITNLDHIRATPIEFTKPYALITLHRQGNVDDKNRLLNIVSKLNSLDESLTLVMSIHPRTRKRINEFEIDLGRIQMIEPQPYINFHALIDTATLVISDSGSIQSETSYMNIPCLTLRDSTERPETVLRGTNTLVGGDLNDLNKLTKRILTGKYKQAKPFNLHDGKVALRIIQTLIDLTEKENMAKISF